MCCKPILMMLFIPTPMVNCSTISTTTPVQNCWVDFHIFTIFVKNSSFCLYLRRHAKFGEDRTIHGRVIAYIRFSKWWTSAIFDLVSADHPRLVFYGPNILLKLHVDCFYILRDITIFFIWPVWLEIAYSRSFWGRFWGIWRVPLGIGYRRQASTN